MLNFPVFLIQCFCICSCLLISIEANALEPTPEQLEFFESKIRPVLVRECYECHNTAETQQGNLALDHQQALLKGGDNGPLLIPGKPEMSLLLRVLRHDIEDLEMPEGGAKLSATVIADFEKWIAMGAPDPREHPPSPEELAHSTSWDAVLDKRKQWWSFQPLDKLAKPQSRETVSSQSVVDQFISEKLDVAGLSRSQQADKRTLIRRLSFTLIGLPPTSEEIENWLKDDSTNAFEKLVEHYLASPRYGEHWARHWMDWVRYAETHGSEGDPAIPYAWQYRDYLIRALNDDVAYDQLVKEHISGDLFEQPRINEKLGINESAIGPAHWRMCFHGFAPTDALDENVRFTDDSINVFSKAFLGLTVSCARCHNHKFDPISQADYYALFGILGSTHPSILDVNTPTRQVLHIEELTQLKAQIRDSLPADWDTELITLHKEHEDVSTSQLTEQSVPTIESIRYQWNLAHPDDFATWTSSGNGTANTTATTFTINHTGETGILQHLPPGTYSHLLSTKHRGILCSPRVTLKGEQDLWVQVAGDGNAVLRYVVHDYPRNGTVYPIRNLTGGDWRWERFDLTYWDGDELHVEISTAPDQPVLATNNERSWFGVRQVIIADKGMWKPPTEPALHPAGQLPNMFAAFSPQLTELINAYRDLESKIPTPTRVPGLLEAGAVNQPLMIRGDHRTLGSEPVPRRFLELIDPKPYTSNNSGRLELAHDLFRDDNPLTSRVIVNRLWHHLYGQGLVRTPDNFGRLGETPSHQALLDWLAIKMRNDGWSIKQMIRTMVMTETWQQQSAPSAEADRVDPENRLLSHAHLRRLEAESIRDQLLVLSGRISPDMYGPPIAGTSHNRRSVYTAIIRNDLDPFLAVFDAPVPFATVGKRDATNVPAQSLTLLNDPFIHSIAKDFANRPEAKNLPDSERIAWYFERALGRMPDQTELASAQSFLASIIDQHQALAKRNHELQGQLEDINSSIHKVIDVKQTSDFTEIPLLSQPLAPYAHWTFDKDINDTLSNLSCEPHGNVRIENGALILDGTSYVASSPLSIEVKERTLQVLLQLDSLQQRGGGAMTLQTLDGNTFDAIVFGEQDPQRWLAGSNNFQRTSSFKGPAEETAVLEPVLITTVWEEDGTIRCYRNGLLYGTPYRLSERISYAKQASQILFGLRHGKTAGGNRLLTGRIHEASFYQRALSPEEVLATAGDSSALKRQQMRAQLSPEKLNELLKHETSAKALEQQIKELGVIPNADDKWKELTHGILNLKEVIYLK